jgi:hypothetical protein
MSKIILRLNQKKIIYIVLYIMFLNPIVSPLDEPIYIPTKNYFCFDVDIFWQTVEYNNNLFKL